MTHRYRPGSLARLLTSQATLRNSLLRRMKSTNEKDVKPYELVRLSGKTDGEEFEMEGEGESDDGNEERGNWSSQIDYLLSVLGFIVALGNVWRFPYICSRNGGGAFLIPFVICLILCGLPIFFLELSIGQFSGRSPIHVWSLCPLIKGVGAGMVIIAAICPVYYTVISAWALFYTIFSCRTELPWTSCNNTWNTPDCVTSIKVLHFAGDRDTNDTVTPVVYNISDTMTTAISNTSIAMTTAISNTSVTYTGTGWSNSTLSHTAAEEFLQYRALGISEGLHIVGELRWELALCLLASWVVVFLCLIKGVKSVGKAVYVTATVPYVILLILLVRGLTLPGGLDGALFYIKPNFSKLLEVQVWLEACLQVFYSLGVCWGCLITMSSYNRFHSNCLRNAMICTFAGEGTSIVAGLVVFSILGFMAHEADIPITDVVSSGPGLGFVIYPEALSQLPVPQLWSFIFFLMLILLAMDSLFCLCEAVICAILDEFPFLLRWRIPVTFGYCLVSFLLGLLLTTQGGVYVFQLIDWYTAAIFPILAGLIECIVMCWVYGIKRFCGDIELMIGRQPPVFFKITWCFVTPVILLTVLVTTVSNYQPPSYGHYNYPDYAAYVGWFIAVLPILPMIPMMGVAIYREEGSFLQRFIRSLRPDKHWGPSKDSYREIYQQKGSSLIPSFQENILSATSWKSSSHA